MTEPLTLVLEEGTTSTRAILFAQDASLRGVAQEELTQFYPQSGWVEHDAGEIWEKTLACARAMVEQAGGAGQVAAIGITNQRETTVVWDRETGTPIHNAIVWQDRRTAEFCDQLKISSGKLIQEKTGLIVDAYFSATKIKWILDQVPHAKKMAEQGELVF